ncbi:MAG: hypothetical protein AAGE52_39085 [Myxococcota bacterium]
MLRRWMVGGALLSAALAMFGSLWQAVFGVLAPEARPTDAELRAVFASERETFETLQRNLLTDEGLAEIRVDSFSWVDPCNQGACARPRTTPLPPGYDEAPCDWEHGCGRWVDEAPTPAILGALGRVSEARAASYLEGLEEVGAVAIQQGEREVSFWMHVQGIVPSGSILEIVWQETPEEVREDTSAHGRRVVRLDGSWSIRERWN